MNGLLPLTAVIVLGGVVVTVAWKFRAKKLRAEAAAAVAKAWRHAVQQPNPTLRVIEADKVLDEALRLSGFNGSLGDKLKKAGPRFGDIDAVWRAHKLRNSLVHELQKVPSQPETDRAMKAFETALRELGMK